MRITVTVVVIMFELTGALTYILPTMVSRWSISNSLRRKLIETLDCPARDEGCRRFLRSQWNRGRSDTIQWVPVPGKG